MGRLSCFSFSLIPLSLSVPIVWLASDPWMAANVSSDPMKDGIHLLEQPICRSCKGGPSIRMAVFFFFSAREMAICYILETINAAVPTTAGALHECRILRQLEKLARYHSVGLPQLSLPSIGGLRIMTPKAHRRGRVFSCLGEQADHP
jgi:hypothetical protein